MYDEDSRPVNLSKGTLIGHFGAALTPVKAWRAEMTIEDDRLSASLCDQGAGVRSA